MRKHGSTILLLAGALLGLAPLDATEPVLETWVVTYDAPPTLAQVETLTGIATGVHRYQHLPAAVAVVPFASAGLLANLPGVRGVYPNRQLQWLLDESTAAILRFDGERVTAFVTSFNAADVAEYRIVGTKGQLHVDPAYEYAEGLKYTLTVGGRTVRKAIGKRVRTSHCVFRHPTRILADWGLFE